MDLNELITQASKPIELHTYDTLQNFLYQNKCCTNRQIDRRALTHTLYSGGTVHLDPELQPMFDYLMASDLRKGRPLFFAELVGDSYRMFCDFDIQTLTPPGNGEELALKIGKLMQETMHKFVDTKHKLIIASAKIKKKEAKGQVYYGPHYHFVWPEVVVTQEQALHIREMALSILNRKFPLKDHEFENGWESRLDEGVYRDKRAGLRMVGNFKCETCECQKEGGLGQCLNAHYGPKKKKNGGRPYSILMVVDEEGMRMSELTERLKNDYYLSIPLTRLHTDQPERVDFKIPEDCPRPSSPEELESIKKLRPRTTISKAQATKEKRAYRFKSSKSLREDYKRKVYLDPHDALYREISKVICSSFINMKYADLYVTSIFTNIKKTYFVVTVDGPGYNYCLNKGDYHNGSNIYFYIGSDLNVHQRCLSPKKEIRPCGKRKCSEWRSRNVALPIRIQDMIRLQRSGSTETFKTFAYRRKVGEYFVNLHASHPCGGTFTCDDVRRIFSDPDMANRVKELQEKAKKQDPKLRQIEL